MTQKDRIYRKILDWGIPGLIVFSPLPAASVYEWSILTIQLAVLVMLAAYFLMADKPRIDERLKESLKWPKALFLGFFLLLGIQILPLPKTLVRIFSPNSYAFQENYMPGFSSTKFISFSLIPAHTLREGLAILPYFILGFLIVRTVTERQQIFRIFYALIGMGVLQALYGLFELYNKNPRILFYEKMYNLDSVTGTFVNRNHFSGYMEMIIPLAIGLAIVKVDLLSLMDLKWKDRILRLSEKNLATGLSIFMGIILMAVAVVFSRSRSGLFLVVLSFILFFGLMFQFFKGTEVQKKKTKKIITIGFLAIVFISLYIGIDATIERFALDKLLREGRPTYWANTVDIFKNYPIFGTGLGTFPALYPDKEEGGTLIRLYHTHNDYLEYLSELGIVGFLLALGGILFILVKSFLIWKGRKQPEAKGLALGGIVAVICILIHSLTDFNLHIPANMLLFTVVLCTTAIIVHFKPDMPKNSRFIQQG